MELIVSFLDDIEISSGQLNTFKVSVMPEFLDYGYKFWTQDSGHWMLDSQC